MADALLKAYPNAKVVLNVRDIDPWLASMETSYYRILAWKPLQVLASIKYVRAPRLERKTSASAFLTYAQSNLAQHTDLLRLILADWTGGDWQNRRKLREEFVKHYAHIRAIVPKDNLLEHRPQDGWGPLCKFLGKPVPDEPYPRVNEGDSVFNIHVTVFWIVAGQLVVKFVAPVLVVAFAFWYYRK
ncbi:hypothetical protein MMC13_001133 [Lambiella insularis]|nr:hypothetical protein [Lambiella insularis]